MAAGAKYSSGEFPQVEDTDVVNLVQIVTGPPDAPLKETSSGADPKDQLAEALVELMKGGGGGGGGGKPTESSAQKWVVRALVGLFASAATLVGAYYATEARSKSNEEAINGHIELPMHVDASERMSAIETSVQFTKKDVSAIRESQKEIVSGIEQLKREAQTSNQKRLERELEEARRELRKRSR